MFDDNDLNSKYYINENYAINFSRNNYFNSSAKKFIKIDENTYIDPTQRINNILNHFEESLKKSKTLYLRSGLKNDIIAYTKYIYNELKKDDTYFKKKNKKVKLIGVFCIVVYLLFKTKFCDELSINIDLQEIINNMPLSSIKYPGNLLIYLSKIKFILKNKNFDLVEKLKDVKPKEQLDHIINIIIDFLVKIDFFQEYYLNFNKKKVLDIIDKILRYKKLYNEKLIYKKIPDVAIALLFIAFKILNIHLNFYELSEKVNSENITNIKYNSCIKIIKDIKVIFKNDFIKLSNYYEKNPNIIKFFKKNSNNFILLYKLYTNLDCKKKLINNIDHISKVITLMLNKNINKLNFD